MHWLWAARGALRARGALDVSGTLVVYTAAASALAVVACKQVALARAAARDGLACAVRGPSGEQHGCQLPTQLGAGARAPVARADHAYARTTPRASLLLTRSRCPPIHLPHPVRAPAAAQSCMHLESSGCRRARRSEQAAARSTRSRPS
jgi:hypothetical protein